MSSPPFRIPVSQPKIGNLELGLVADCLRRNQLSQGPMVARFEQEFAAYVGARYAVATSSGTTALHLALAALGIGPGDEVLVPDLTFIATANAVVYCGATPVLVDADPATWCMGPSQIAAKLSYRSRAIIPVHLYGVQCDYSTSRGLFVVEDACEGLGGRYITSGRALGTVGDCGVFSFYANKVIGVGEGGMVVTDNEQFAERLRLYRGQGWHPSDARYYHSVVGFNYRMTELQAAVGVGQLQRLLSMLAARRAIFDRYAHHLDGYLPSPPCSTDVGSAPWQYTTMLPPGVSRDGLADALAAAGIETRPVFVPLHRLPMYRASYVTEVGGDGPSLADVDFPAAAAIADAGISLPTFADMTMAQVDEVAQRVVDYVARQTTGDRP